jgi:hypothetical protein
MARITVAVIPMIQAAESWAEQARDVLQSTARKFSVRQVATLDRRHFRRTSIFLQGATGDRAHGS